MLIKGGLVVKTLLAPAADKLGDVFLLGAGEEGNSTDMGVVRFVEGSRGHQRYPKDAGGA